MSGSAPNEVPEVVHNPGTILLGIFAAVVIFQWGLLQWKEKHRRSYNLFSLGILWLFPIYLSMRSMFLRFIVVWLVYSVINGLILRKIMQPKLDPDTPKLVYRFYRLTFNATMGVAAFGYGLFLVDVFAWPSVGLTDFSLTLIFYGLYFGVLSRDLIDFGADKMASTIGYYSKEGFPSKSLRSNICAICGDETRSAGEAFRTVDDDSAASSLISAKNLDKVILLNCRHSVHTGCLYGWCMIGKKDMCPYCKEKVDLSLIQSNPWKDPEFLYGKLLDFARYLVVWQPILLFLLHVVINVLKR